MISFSIRASVGHESWEYNWSVGETHDGQEEERCRPSLQAPPSNAAPSPRQATTTTRRADKEHQTQNRRPQLTESGSSYASSVDTSYVSLSSTAQELQLRAREQQRKRLADADSLRMLERATADPRQLLKERRNSDAKIIPANAASRQPGEHHQDHARAISGPGDIGASDQWPPGSDCGSSDPSEMTWDDSPCATLSSSTDFCKVLHLDVADTQPESASSNVYGTPNPSNTDGKPLRRNLTKDLATASCIVAVTESKEARESHNYHIDPFGSMLVVAGEDRKSRPGESNMAIKKGTAESVQKLFNLVRLKDKALADSEAQGVVRESPESAKKASTSSRQGSLKNLRVQGLQGFGVHEDGRGKADQEAATAESQTWEEQKEEEDDWLMV